MTKPPSSYKPGSGNVTKLQASDGVSQGTFPTGCFPQAVAFDGANIWVTAATVSANFSAA